MDNTPILDDLSLTPSAMPNLIVAHPLAISPGHYTYQLILCYSARKTDILQEDNPLYLFPLHYHSD